MAISFNKREQEKKKQNKKLEKQKRKEERKANSGSTSFEDMIAYVDEFGVITDTPPEPSKEEIDIESIEISTPKQEKEAEETPIGIVDRFVPEKGYGFIKIMGRQETYFFHISNAPASIAEGNQVTFDLERGPKGMNAVNIALVSEKK